MQATFNYLHERESERERGGEIAALSMKRPCAGIADESPAGA